MEYVLFAKKSNVATFHPNQVKTYLTLGILWCKIELESKPKAFPLQKD
jgi:hypothetical protein